MARLLCLALVTALSLVSTVAPAVAQRAVIVVRHAEKLDQSKDPPLSEAGTARAVRLATMLRDAQVRGLYATEYRRTRDTLLPLAKALGLSVAVVDSGDPEALVRRMRTDHADGVVVVAGHSNTVPRILELLGASPPVQLADDEYDSLFIVTPRGDGPPTVVRLHF